MKYLFATLFFFISTTSYAQIYMQQDQSGNVSYSDVPSANSSDVTPTSGTTSTPPSQANPQQSNTSSTVAEVAEKTNYTVFNISNLQDQDTIQNNPNIEVDIDIEPALQKGNKIQIVIDGKPVGQPQANTKIMIGRLERGTHLFSAQLLDSTNVIIKQTNPITVYVHYAHLGGSVSNTKPIKPKVIPAKKVALRN